MRWYIGGFRKHSLNARFLPCLTTLKYDRVLGGITRMQVYFAMPELPLGFLKQIHHELILFTTSVNVTALPFISTAPPSFLYRACGIRAEDIPPSKQLTQALASEATGQAGESELLNAELKGWHRAKLRSITWTRPFLNIRHE